MVGNYIKQILDSDVDWANLNVTFEPIRFDRTHSLPLVAYSELVSDEGGKGRTCKPFRSTFDITIIAETYAETVNITKTLIDAVDGLYNTSLVGAEIMSIDLETIEDSGSIDRKDGYIKTVELTVVYTLD